MLFLKKEQLHRSIIMSLMLLTLLLKSTSPRRKSRKIINVIYQKVQLMVNATLPFVPHSTAFWPLAPKSRFEKKVLENLIFLCNFQWVSFTYSLFLSAICPLLRRCMSVILFAVMDSLSLIFFSVACADASLGCESGQISFSESLISRSGSDLFQRVGFGSVFSLKIRQTWISIIRVYQNYNKSIIS